MAIRDKRFTILEGESVSNSIDCEHLDIIGLWVPAMETLTVLLAFEATRDGPEVADGAATWVRTFDPAGTAIGSPVVAATPRRMAFDRGAFLSPGRVRLVALVAAGTAINQTVARVVVPIFRDAAQG